VSHFSVCTGRHSIGEHALAKAPNATEESVKANKESMQEPGIHGERFKELVQELKLAFLARG